MCLLAWTCTLTVQNKHAEFPSNCRGGVLSRNDSISFGVAGPDTLICRKPPTLSRRRLTGFRWPRPVCARCGLFWLADCAAPRRIEVRVRHWLGSEYKIWRCGRTSAPPSTRSAVRVLRRRARARKHASRGGADRGVLEWLINRRLRSCPTPSLTR
jgi:hypothetical protein